MNRPVTAELHDERQKGWFWMDNTILDDYGATVGPYGIALYALLARHADDKRRAFPSLQRMMKMLDLSRQSIVRTLDLLEQHGLIRRERQQNAKQGKTNNIYTLLTPSSPQALALVPHVDQGSSPDRLPLVPVGTYPSSPRRPEQDLREQDPYQQDTHTLPLSVPKAVAYSPGFTKFWTGYPVKKEKQEAWKAWKQLKLEPLTATIVASISEHAAKDRNWQQGYIKHPATYLRKGCWTDELDMPQLSSEAAAPRNLCPHEELVRADAHHMKCVKCKTWIATPQEDA